MQNGFNLVEFDFSFLIDFDATRTSKVKAIDKFPRQVFDLISKLDGDIRRIETH